LAVPALWISQLLLRLTRKEGNSVRLRTKIAGALLALASVGGGVALTASPAHATWTYPGLSVIDTEGYGTSPYSCDAMAQGHVGDGNIYCYTWIRTNGVLRRGSYVEYFSEAQGGYVLTACSASPALAVIGSTNAPFGDFWGNAQTPIRYLWAAASNHPYCLSPVLGPGYVYSGYRWNQVANGNPQ
jgi:hypothetical protein